MRTQYSAFWLLGFVSGVYSGTSSLQVESPANTRKKPLSFVQERIDFYTNLATQDKGKQGEQQKPIFDIPQVDVKELMQKFSATKPSQQGNAVVETAEGIAKSMGKVHSGQEERDLTAKEASVFIQALKKTPQKEQISPPNEILATQILMAIYASGVSDAVKSLAALGILTGEEPKDVQESLLSAEKKLGFIEEVISKIDTNLILANKLSPGALVKSALQQDPCVNPEATTTPIESCTTLASNGGGQSTHGGVGLNNMLTQAKMVVKKLSECVISKLEGAQPIEEEKLAKSEGDCLDKYIQINTGARALVYILASTRGGLANGANYERDLENLMVYISDSDRNLPGNRKKYDNPIEVLQAYKKLEKDQEQNAVDEKMKKKKLIDLLTAVITFPNRPIEVPPTPLITSALLYIWSWVPWLWSKSPGKSLSEEFEARQKADKERILNAQRKADEIIKNL